MRKRLSLAFLSALLLLLSACAAKEIPTGDPAVDHFLGAEYGKMTQVVGHPERMAWRKPGLDPRQYTAVLLDKTVIWRADELARTSGANPDELAALAAYFDGVLKKTMEGMEFPLATEAKPRVMRISAAVVKIKTSNPTRNTISSVLPIGILIGAVDKAATGTYPNVGSCTIEVRFSDAATGESIGLFSDHKDGDKYDSANFSKLGQAEKAMDQWAEMLRQGILKNWGARQ